MVGAFVALIRNVRLLINPRWKMRQVLGEGGDLQSDLMAALGLKEEWLSRWPSELSGGELQRFS